MSNEKKVDRSLFKNKTSVEELKVNDQKIENLIDKKNSDYAGFLKIENGPNKFRIYPGHPREDDVKPQWIASKQTWWLPFLIEEKDDKGEIKKDKKGNPILSEKNRPVFDARNHSNINKDIVAIYIELVNSKLMDEFGDTKIVEQKTKCIIGSYAENINGVKGKPTWVCYVDKYVGKEKAFGRIEFPKAVRNRINTLISIEEANEPVSTDGVDNPFTDPDDGRLLIVNYNKDAKKAADYYAVELDSSFDKETKMINVVPLTQFDLETFMKYPSLNDLYIDIYTKRDFDLAIEGLQYFDNREEFGIMQDKDFLNTIEEMRSLYPDAPDKDESGLEVENDDDDFDSMTRAELKKYSQTNMTGIIVLPKMTDDELRDEIKKWVKKQNEPEEEQEQEKEIVVKEEEKTEDKISSRQALKDKMKNQIKK